MSLRVVISIEPPVLLMSVDHNLRSSSRASSRDGMRRPTSSGSRKIALQNVLEGTRKEIGHGEVYQSDQHSDERNRIGFGGRVERLGGSGRVGHGGASRTGEDDRERVAESVRS